MCSLVKVVLFIQEVLSRSVNIIDVLPRLGFVDVVHYLVSSGHVDVTRCDSHNRSLLFTAVMSNKPEMVRYLVARVSCLCCCGSCSYNNYKVSIHVPWALVADTCCYIACCWGLVGVKWACKLCFTVAVAFWNSCVETSMQGR